MTVKNNNRAIIATVILGILVSTYALYVELSVEAHGANYEAMCDISEHVKCSRVLTSKYAKGFGLLPKDYQLPNPIYGLCFYCLIIFLTTFDQLRIVQVQLILVVLSDLCSVYLAYILAFVLYDFCVVCVSTYVVNAIVTMLVYKKIKLLSEKRK